MYRPSNNISFDISVLKMKVQLFVCCLYWPEELCNFPLILSSMTMTLNERYTVQCTNIVIWLWNRIYGICSHKIKFYSK